MSAIDQYLSFNPITLVSYLTTSDQPSLRRTLPTHCRTLEVINPAAQVWVEPTSTQPSRRRTKSKCCEKRHPHTPPLLRVTPYPPQRRKWAVVDPNNFSAVMLWCRVEPTLLNRPVAGHSIIHFHLYCFNYLFFNATASNI